VTTALAQAATKVTSVRLGTRAAVVRSLETTSSLRAERTGNEAIITTKVDTKALWNLAAVTVTNPVTTPFGSLRDDIAVATQDTATVEGAIPMQANKLVIQMQADRSTIAIQWTVPQTVCFWVRWSICTRSTPRKKTLVGDRRLPKCSSPRLGQITMMLCLPVSGI